MSQPDPIFPNVFVVPGVGRKLPLPIPAGGGMVPALGRTLTRDLTIERMLATGDLVTGKVAENLVEMRMAEAVKEVADKAAAEKAAADKAAAEKAVSEKPAALPQEKKV